MDGTRAKRALAAAAMACAMGCSLAASNAPAVRSTSSCVRAPSTTTPLTASFPVVTVPVLSSTMVSTVRVSSSTCGPRIRMPSWAPRPVPVRSAVGVARPRAHGHAMTRTATAAVNARLESPVNTSQARNVTTAIPRTIGTKTALMRSARRAMRALPLWA